MLVLSYQNNMVQVQTDFSNIDIYRIDILKARLGLKNRSDAVKYIVSNYKDVLLEIGGEQNGENKQKES